MRDEAEKRIGHLYPPVEVTSALVRERPDLKPYEGRKLTVIAWLWARTVKSPNPAFADVDVPLASTFMLSTKKGKEAYVEPVIEGRGYRFEVNVGPPPDEDAARAGTKLSRGANFRCLMLLVRLNAKIEDSHEIDRGYTLEPAATLEGPTDFIGITEIDGSAGPGAVVYHEGISSQAKFPRRWLSDHDLTARSCRVIRVKGESMEPTLPNRSLVLVNLASDERKQHGIFAIRTGDELIVKRLAFDPKVGWLLESDHPDRTEWPNKTLARRRGSRRRGQVGRAKPAVHG